MRYHYFTIEQRETLSRVIQGMTNRDDGSSGVDSALARLRSPDYGVCEICEGDVPFVRLLADPLARRCGRCEPGT
jgi:RNA polymerase-binding transcription factor DksA